MVFFKNSYVEAKKMGNELFLLYNPIDEKIITINGTGWFVWSQIDGKNKLVEIADALFQSFEAENFHNILIDIEQFITQLEKVGFLVKNLEETTNAKFELS